jgi:chemotaxis signal transduction protein
MTWPASVSVYLRLRVASEAYAIPVQDVTEVTELGEVTTVPGSLPEILGVRNLRGRVLPVIDLARLLGTARAAPPARLLVAEVGGVYAGFAIDAVSDVGEMEDPTEETESGLLTGATLAGGDLIGVIDVGRVLASLEERARDRSRR